MIEVDLRKHHPMFRRAWQSIVGFVKDLTVDESRRVWKETFGCDMITDKDHKFVTAVFERDEDYTAFLLRWA